MVLTTWRWHASCRIRLRAAATFRPVTTCMADAKSSRDQQCRRVSPTPRTSRRRNRSEACCSAQRRGQGRPMMARALVPPRRVRYHVAIVTLDRDIEVDGRSIRWPGAGRHEAPRIHHSAARGVALRRDRGVENALLDLPQSASLDEPRRPSCRWIRVSPTPGSRCRVAPSPQHLLRRLRLRRRSGRRSLLCRYRHRTDNARVRRGRTGYTSSASGRPGHQASPPLSCRSLALSALHTRRGGLVRQPHVTRSVRQESTTAIQSGSKACCRIHRNQRVTPFSTSTVLSPSRRCRSEHDISWRRRDPQGGVHLVPQPSGY